MECFEWVPVQIPGGSGATHAQTCPKSVPVAYHTYTTGDTHAVWDKIAGNNILGKLLNALNLTLLIQWHFNDFETDRTVGMKMKTLMMHDVTLQLKKKDDCHNHYVLVIISKPWMTMEQI